MGPDPHKEVTGLEGLWTACWLWPVDGLKTAQNVDSSSGAPQGWSLRCCLLEETCHLWELIGGVSTPLSLACHTLGNLHSAGRRCDTLALSQCLGASRPRLQLPPAHVHSTLLPNGPVRRNKTRRLKHLRAYTHSLAPCPFEGKDEVTASSSRVPEPRLVRELLWRAVVVAGLG